MKKTPPEFNNNVFINCPFDDSYIRIFRAVIFTVHSLGFRARCSQEFNDGRERLKKIMGLIKSCKYGIHDISRIQRSGKMPRFNMPFELGIDVAFQEGGDKILRKKSLLVLDSDPYRFRHFLSDISGRDPRSHGNTVRGAIRAVRDWLDDEIRNSPRHPLPSANLVHKEYVLFRRNLRRICAESKSKLTVQELTFNDYDYVVAEWLKQRALELNSQVGSPPKK